jgi:hypothetical protein
LTPGENGKESNKVTASQAMVRRLIAFYNQLHDQGFESRCCMAPGENTYENNSNIQPRCGSALVEHSAAIYNIKDLTRFCFAPEANGNENNKVEGRQVAVVQ